ncbi:MAG: DNA-binding protein, partial [Halobacteriaceae archaeon]
MGGIRAEVKFNALSGCEVATASDVTGAACTSISRATTGEHSDNTVTEEFVLNSDSSLESSDADGIPDDLQEIFTYGSRRAYRFTRSRDRNCPCDRIEQYDCPILDVYSRDGSLVVAFHASDTEQLREILTDLNDRNAGMSVHRLIRSEENRGDQ